eukprot:11911-Eustigmatos_ZCMA.PRE.1
MASSQLKYVYIMSHKAHPDHVKDLCYVIYAIVVSPLNAAQLDEKLQKESMLITRFIGDGGTEWYLLDQEVGIEGLKERLVEQLRLWDVQQVMEVRLEEVPRVRRVPK